MRMIVTKPQHDVTTKYLSSWAGEIIDFARKKSVEICDLVKEKANKAEFEGRVKKLKPEVIFLNGHGGDSCVTGHDNEELVSVRENHNILDDKITYALSCNSAKILGIKIAENKSATYIGYSDEFVFVGDSSYISRPLDDPKAKPFMEASNQVMISLLKGNSAKDASDRSKNKFKDFYEHLSSSNTDPDSLQVAQCLWWDMRNQVCLGNIDAKL
ncbi:MAG: hypothetical protein Q8M83_06315 [bacterium]|nr:hypothetical protein [bacterium]